VYDYPNCLESNKTNIDRTPGMIELMSNMYGLYPYYAEKYGHYMWYPPSFSGMEHITMSGMRYFSFDLIAHELGHSWFGDNVTCASWSDIWVNEGFATYSQYLARQSLLSQGSADYLMSVYMDYVLQSSTGSVYVPEDELSSWGRIFNTRLTYRKGGALVHMIRFEMQNDSLFFKTHYEFQELYKDSVATGMDFKAVCEQVSGLDFTDFFNQWYFGEGFPIYGLDWWQHEDTLFMNVEQSTSNPVTPLYKMPMEYLINHTGGDTTIRFYHLTNDTTFRFITSHEVEEIEIDPNNWVLNQVGEVTHRKLLDLSVLLEGPYDDQLLQMITELNDQLLPLVQPYNTPPWNYNGSEHVLAIPNEDVVDWMLLGLYDTTDASFVSSGNPVEQLVCFLHNDGSLTGIDGSSLPYFLSDINNNLFIGVFHRNHLPVLSSTALNYSKGIYTYDFSSGELQVYGNSSGHKELIPGLWGMISGDANADQSVDGMDKSDVWENSAGVSGYLQGDLNLNSQSDNVDKDEYWLPNLGSSSQIPE